MKARGSRGAIRTCTAFLALFLAFSIPGCGRVETGLNGRPQETKEAPSDQQEPVEETAVPEENGALVHMCGRSVLGAWFEHWGGSPDPAIPALFRGYALLYHEMESPPRITGSALGVIEGAGRGDLLFFKLCFEDFEGGEEATARSNLERNQRIIETVVGAASRKGLPVLLGNALPMVAEYTEYWLVWNHRQYNRFLERLASEHPGRVSVVDLYGVLASPDGSLRAEYALQPQDSHLNDAAYDALDGVLEGALYGLRHTDH